MSFNTRPIYREYAGGSVAGILRKTGGTNNQQQQSISSNSVYGATIATPQAYGTSGGGVDARQLDLLVFGYACKVFRDDAKALEIDQGKHLIPWMGDNALKIDRYDVRGALYELAPYEPPPGGYGNRLEYLSAEEQRAEQLCEEERYLFLYNNEEEHILHQEEELKRFKQESASGYQQVAFQYTEGEDSNSGVQRTLGPSVEKPSEAEEKEQAYQLPRNFDVPPCIQLPETMKQHAIIEKTARFIASQGTQMEILLKAKQSNNAQFEFLNQNSTLNPYYKFIVNAIKNGTYPAEEKEEQKKDNASDSSSNKTPEDSDCSPTKSVVTVPVIKYKPSPNCAYTQLISKIKGVPLPAIVDDNAMSGSPSAMASASAADSPSNSNSNAHFTPVLLQYNGNTTFVSEREETNSNSNANLNTNSNSQDSTGEPQVKILSNSSALALAQNYSSDSESEVEPEKKEDPQPEPKLDFPIPEESLKNIIDKTATYVIKNGRQFEETLRTKSEERFTFLVPENEFYAYYMYKITGDPLAASREQKTRKAAAVAAALLSKKGIGKEKTLTPVSFSLKTNNDAATIPKPAALTQDPSDDEEEQKSNNESTTNPNRARTVPESVQKAIKLVENQLMARNSAGGAPALPAPLLPATGPLSPTTLQALGKNFKSPQERLNALYEQQQQNRVKEQKKAEEKVKDKLAQIAREKLGGLVSKEKQIQLERKRKAMAFLSQIKDTVPTVEDTAPAKKVKNTNDDTGNGSDSDTSVHSIPISSYGPDEENEDEDEQSSKKLYTPALSTEERSQAKVPSASIIALSDDDDVQVVSEMRAPPRQREQGSSSQAKSPAPTRLKRKSRSRSRLYTPAKHKKSKSRRSRSRSPSCSDSNSDAGTTSSFTHSSTNDDDADDRRSGKHRSHRSTSRTSHRSHKSKKSSKSRRKKKSKKHRHSSRSRSRSRSRSAKDPKRHHRRRHSSRSASRESAQCRLSSANGNHHHNYQSRAGTGSSRSERLSPSTSSYHRKKEKKRKYEH